MRTASPARAGGFSARLLRCVSGISAAELALVSPVLVLGTFGMTDAGMAIHERMMMDRILHAGARIARQGADESVVLGVIEQAAADDFTLADGVAVGDELELDIETSCVCPGESETGVLCGAVCDSGSPAPRLYRLTANKTFEGVILPEFTLFYALEVMQE